MFIESEMYQKSPICILHLKKCDRRVGGPKVLGAHPTSWFGWAVPPAYVRRRENRYEQWPWNERVYVATLQIS